MEQSLSLIHISRGSGHAEQEKPFGLVKRGKDVELQRGSYLVPNAVVVTRDHAEAIVAWTEILSLIHI